MIEHLKRSGHPVFRGTSPLNRGILRRKAGRNTIHFTAESANIELLLRTIHSANQLSVYGAISSWCDEFAENMPGQTSLGVDKSISKANDHLSKQLNSQEIGSLVQNQKRTEEVAGNSWRDHLQRFKINNSVQSVNQPDAQDQSLLECAKEPVMM